MTPPDLIQKRGLHYSTPLMLVVEHNDNGFSIQCRPTPWISIAWHTFFATIFCGVMIYVFYRFDGKVRSDFRFFGFLKPFWLAVSAGIGVVLGMPLFAWLFHRYEQGRGPTLVYEAHSRTILLPRDDRSFKLHDVEALLSVTAHPGNDEHAQLQLLARGERFVVVPAHRAKDYGEILSELTELLRVPVRVFAQKSGKHETMVETTPAESAPHTA